jgi:hypothetical protein
MNWTGLLLMLTIAGLNMGNEGCDQRQLDKGRQLKLEVEVGSIQGRTVRLPNGETVDFPFVVNSLFYREIMDSGYFDISNPIPPLPGSSVRSASGSGVLPQYEALPLMDQSLLNRYKIGQRPTLGSVAARSAVSEVPACLVQAPQARLGGEVISFAATWGVGLGIGYDRNGLPLASTLPVGAQVDFSQSELELGLRSDDPLSGRVDSIASGISQKSDIKFGVNFFAGLPLGVSFFFQEKMSNVIRSALRKGLDAIALDYRKRRGHTTGAWNEVWQSRVIADPAIANNDTHVAFRGGDRHGVKVGDRFIIENVRYKWQGSPCKTPLEYQIATGTPVVEVTVVGVGDMVSVGSVKNLRPGQIQAGDRVRVLELASAPKESL